MSYLLTRTSMSLDSFTLGVLETLGQKWSVSKAEVIRRAVRRIQEEEDIKDQRPAPLQALDWLQSTGGHTPEASHVLREELRAERNAQGYWWES